MAGPASSVIFSTPTTSTMRAARGRDRAQALMDRGRAGGAGVLDPGRGLEAQGRVGLQHERAGEVLGDEAAVEVAEPDLVDLGGLEAGIGDGRGRGLDDQALDVLRPSCLPNGRWLQPTMQAVMARPPVRVAVR